MNILSTLFAINVYFFYLQLVKVMLLFKYGGDILNERIRELRKALGYTLERFGSRLGVTKTAISNIERGERNVTDQMFVSICREFDVNEEWLRTGEGPMFREMSQREKAAYIVGKVLKNEDEFRQKIFIALGEMTDEEWDLVKKFVDKLK